MNQTVLEFLEKHLPTKKADLPTKVMVKRTTQSKYVFYLAVRLWRRKLGLEPQFVNYNRQDLNSHIGQIEERSIFHPTRLFVMEGFARTVLDRINVAQGTYILAETDEADLKVEPFSYRSRRDLLKVLHAELKLSRELALSYLLKLDWSACTSYEEHEPILRRAALMDWTPEQLDDFLGKAETGTPLWELKGGQVLKVLNEVERMGPTWLPFQYTKGLADLISWRVLALQGADETKIRKELDIGYRKGQEIAQLNQALTATDVEALVRRRIELDPLFTRMPGTAAELFLLNAPTRLRK